jgi:hypothetical protein
LALNEVLGGLLVKILTVTGRRIAVAFRGARNKRDFEILTWFETQAFSEKPRRLPKPPHGIDRKQLLSAIETADVEAILHELVAFRLLQGVGASPDALREALISVVSTLLPLSDQSVAIRYGQLLFEHLDAEITQVISRLQKSKPELLIEIRSNAIASRMSATLSAVERHTAVIAASHSPQRSIHEFLQRYQKHVVEHHGMLQPPDLERRRRVPIAELYVAPTAAEFGGVDPEDRPKRLSLDEIIEGLDRTVVLGDPGSGKTTLCDVALHHYAANGGYIVPFLVTLREFSSVAPSASFLSFIEQRLRTFYQCPTQEEELDHLLLSGGALVVFDGLDELVDTSRRVELAGMIERFCTEYPLVRILVTSRVVGYSIAQLDDRQFTAYRLEDFDAKQIEEYAMKWFSYDMGYRAANATDLARAFLEESEIAADLRANPLMLALMCILYRGFGSIPRNRPELYEQCTALLLRRWDSARKIHADLRAPHLVEPALHFLAYWMLTERSHDSAVKERELIDVTAGFLAETGFETQVEAREAAGELIEFCKGRAWVLTDIGTTAHGERLYSFTHRTFLEYFAAYYLTSTTDTPEQLARRLAPRIASQEWDAIAGIAIQIRDRTTSRGADRILDVLLTGTRRRPRKARCNGGL